MPGGPKAEGLVLDHEHALGYRAVRGLVCNSHNCLIQSVDQGRRKPDEAISAYLRRPWWHEVGLDPQCPTDCRWTSHRRLGPPAPRPTGQVLTQVRQAVDAHAVPGFRRWTAEELSWAADPSLSTAEVALRARRTYSSAQNARRKLAAQQPADAIALLRQRMPWHNTARKSEGAA